MFSVFNLLSIEGCARVYVSRKAVGIFAFCCPAIHILYMNEIM